MCVAVPVGGGSVYCEVLAAGSSEGSFSTQLLCSIRACDYAAHLTVQGHIQVRTHKVLQYVFVCVCTCTVLCLHFVCKLYNIYVMYV